MASNKMIHDRATLAQEELAKLEAALNSKTATVVPGQKEVLGSLIEVQKNLEMARAERELEREKARKEKETLAVENAKLRYQILHLTRALQEADNEGAKACA